MGQLNDGTILSWNGVYFKPSGELFGIGCRSDGEQVFTDSHEIPVHMPPDTVKPRDPRTPGKTMVDMMFGTIIELPSGEILSAACGASRGHENWRVFILKSTDREDSVLLQTELDKAS